MSTPSEKDLRQYALNQAVSLGRAGHLSTEAVIDTAEKFFEFLNKKGG